jgi:carbamoyl-phosphate synthase large subunit
MIIGAGPIIIGQACEFDYSGTQACKALKEEGYEVILVNSNPATIMTDPNYADRTYIEPIRPDFLREIIKKERPEALLPTMGGQTSLNNAVELAKNGTLKEFGVELIGAKLEAIEVAEDRDKFKKLMESIGLKTPRSGVASTLLEGKEKAEEIGFPVILRPAFTLGGYGGGIAYNIEELEEILLKGLRASPNKQVLIEQSVLGWKEIEYEVMRDLNDNVVIICAIENIDPMGIHTGDSITVAPTQTLSDKEYQMLRDASKKVIRAVGVETGGSNIQFAMNPENGDFIVIEMNPRVSRSSALASKATGFPIAKIAAKLAVGYTLDEIPNDITKKTMASFEPSIDYVVSKIPRFAFEKFPKSQDKLGTQMKSVGETMAIGRTFKESFQKALRSLENRGSLGFINPEIIKENIGLSEIKERQAQIKNKISKASSKRIISVFDAFYLGLTIDEVYEATKIDKWFLAHMKEIVYESINFQRKENIFKNKKHTLIDELKKYLSKDIKSMVSKEKLLDLKKQGFSDKQISLLLEITEEEVFRLRKEWSITPVYKTIDTCAGEFESYTPYHYSSYEEENEVIVSEKEKIIIIGGGPNRIGQGIEFDYCCVHACQALKEEGYETIMINNNPETVSTDYDTSDKLYFEPITAEDVISIWEQEKKNHSKLKGVIVQLGGQTPLNISKALKDYGIKILGTQPEEIEKAEDRDLFGQLIKKLNLRQSSNSIAYNTEDAKKEVEKIGYPVVLRPSYVLGGRGMDIAYKSSELDEWLERTILEENQFPVLIDKFLDRATEIDVDAISDGQETVIAGIMEHIEHAGIHSGDSASVYPSQNLSAEIISEIKKASTKLAKALNVIGLMNIQFAAKDEKLYILEVNPRASRSVPFISKATGIPWAKLASLIMAGKTIKELNIEELLNSIPHDQVSVKEAVFSFNKFENTDIFLGPEMKSTGEVMGISRYFPNAFAKSQIAANLNLPKSGKVFLSFSDIDKDEVLEIGRELLDIGYEIVSTSGTANILESEGLLVERTVKVKEGRPNITDLLKNNKINLIFNIPSGKDAYEDSEIISKIALANNIAVITTVTGAKATIKGLKSLQEEKIRVTAIQDYSQETKEKNNKNILA